MFFEINVYKNISVFQATEVFLIGGIASLVATMVLYEIIPSGNGTDFMSALAIGFIEETAKMLIIGYFINSFRLNYIFNGLLVGACVGAGFAVFETSGYTSQFGLITLFVRSWQSIGTHTIWSAIVGAAIILAKERRKPVKAPQSFEPNFYGFMFWPFCFTQLGIGNHQLRFLARLTCKSGWSSLSDGSLFSFWSMQGYEKSGRCRANASLIEEYDEN